MWIWLDIGTNLRGLMKSHSICMLRSLACPQNRSKTWTEGMSRRFFRSAPQILGPEIDPHRSNVYISVNLKARITTDHCVLACDLYSACLFCTCLPVLSNSLVKTIFLPFSSLGIKLCTASLPTHILVAAQLFSLLTSAVSTVYLAYSKYMDVR